LIGSAKHNPAQLKALGAGPAAGGFSFTLPNFLLQAHLICHEFQSPCPLVPALGFSGEMAWDSTFWEAGKRSTGSGREDWRKEKPKKYRES
jgi:hypothetical protein